jgi:hypothetical protein
MFKYLICLLNPNKALNLNKSVFRSKSKGHYKVMIFDIIIDRTLTDL